METEKVVSEMEELPKTIVRRVVKDKLHECSPDADINVHRDSLLAFSESARIFIHYLSATANDICKESKRQTINADDVLKALEEIDFSEFIGPLRASLDEFKQKNAGKRAGALKLKEEKKKQKVEDEPAKSKEEKKKQKVEDEPAKSKEEKKKQKVEDGQAKSKEEKKKQKVEDEPAKSKEEKKKQKVEDGQTKSKEEKKKQKVEDEPLKKSAGKTKQKKGNED